MADYTSDTLLRTANVDAVAIEQLRDRLRRAVERGPLPSLQVAVARAGELVLFETFGQANNATRYVIYSCTKPLVASAIWKLMGDGLIDIQLPVASYLPWFTGAGKERVTTRQLLCHTGGFPSARLDAPQWWTSSQRKQVMAGWQLEWEPDSRVEYHPLSSWWVLAELITACSGLDYREYLRDCIVDPLDLQSLELGVRQGEGGDVAAVSHVEARQADHAIGDLGSAVNWPDMRDDALLSFNEPAILELGIPGGGAVSTAADVAMFYQALIGNAAGLWDTGVLNNAVQTIHADLADPATGAPANRGLGVVIAGDDRFVPWRGMGDKVSPRAFGHQGVGGQVSWGDPATGLSFCMLTNGLDTDLVRSAILCAGASNRVGACALRG